MRRIANALVGLVFGAVLVPLVTLALFDQLPHDPYGGVITGAIAAVFGVFFAAEFAANDQPFGRGRNRGRN